MGFSASVAIGLAVAGLYIGGRLFAKATLPPEPLVVSTVARPVPQAVAPKPSPLPPALPEPVKAKAIPPQAPQAPTELPALINPRPGETYLQLGAFGLVPTERYLKEIEAKGIHASVAPGPDETLCRVVLGPFANREELKRQREALEAAGIQSMERLY